MTEIEKELERFIASGKATTKVNSGGFQTTHIDPLKIAKYFAQWQREQMMKDAVEADIAESFTPVSESPDIYMHGFTCVYEEKESTPYVVAPCKVKLIIIKE